MNTPDDPLPASSAPDGYATRYGDTPADPDATGGPTPTPSTDPDATRYLSASIDPDATEYKLRQSETTRTAARWTLPCRFGEYELLDEIARGGMGVVYKARQTFGVRERLVALKMIRAGRLDSPEAVERFLHESHAAAALDHACIVPIYDIGEIDDRHYFTMPLLTGGTLADRVREGPLPPQVAARFLRQVAEALQHAHERGIIHRDLKPGNVLLATCRGAPDGTDRAEKDDYSHPSHEIVPKVTDFGLARTGESSLSITGEALGTPSYMPPEQARGQLKAMGPRSDVYGLGAVLYCLLTGRPPFHSADRLETMRQVCETEPVPPRLLNPHVPRDLETICLKCLEKEVDKRYDSAAEVVAELGRYERGEPVRSRPVSGAERAWRWCKRNPVVAGLAMLAAMLLLALSVVSVLFALYVADKERKARNRADAAEESLKRLAAKLAVEVSDSGSKRVEHDLATKLSKANVRLERLETERAELAARLDAAKDDFAKMSKYVKAVERDLAEKEQHLKKVEKMTSAALEEKKELQGKLDVIARTMQETRLWFVLKNATEAPVRYKLRWLTWNGETVVGKEEKIAKKSSIRLSAPPGAIRIDVIYDMTLGAGEKHIHAQRINAQSFPAADDPKIINMDCKYTFEASRDRKILSLIWK
jgi:serine/threonine protein kinase